MSYLLGRRRLLLDLGRGTVAVALLGAAACTSGSGDGAPQAGPTSPGQSPSPDGAAGTGAGWTRVDLGFVAAYVLVRGNEAAVVDTGVSGSGGAIGASLSAAGSSWSAVRHVVLTHYHPDHAGAITEVLQQAGSATGYVGEADLAQVASPRPLRAVADGTEIFDLQVVATPGHTPGHISIFDPEAGALVAGDALTNIGGLTGANPQYTADPAQARESVRKLAELPVRTIYVGHGAPLDDGAAEALRTLAAAG